MRKLAAVVIGISVVVPGLALTPSPGSAQSPIVYSVKFVCGLQATMPSNPPNEPPVKPGNYATAINIHNFHDFPVLIVKKAVIANPEGSPNPGPISKPRQVPLEPNQALEVDCTDIVTLFPAGIALPPFIKGFVEIRPLSTAINQGPELSVVGVYTAKECHKFAPPSAPPACREFGELSLQVVPYRQPFTLP